MRPSTSPTSERSAWIHQAPWPDERRRLAGASSVRDQPLENVKQSFDNCLSRSIHRVGDAVIGTTADRNREITTLFSNNGTGLLDCPLGEISPTFDGQVSVSSSVAFLYSGCRVFCEQKGEKTMNDTANEAKAPRDKARLRR